MATQAEKTGTLISSLQKNITCDELHFRQLVARCLLSMNAQVAELAVDLHNAQTESASLKEALNEMIRQSENA